ncbi:MAG: hypothetical protein ACI4J1_07385 [Ruminiclostridium sp.]
MKKKSLVKSIILSSISILVIVLITVCSVFSTDINVKYYGTKKHNFYYTVSAESNEMNSWIAKHMTIAEI